MSICLKCAFYNPEREYGCEMSDDLPVTCSVKMRKMREEKRMIRNEIQE